VTVPIYAALDNSAISHITTRHEQGAGFMADGYFRASRKPAVAIVISGPGVTNIATAMGEAYTDSVPLLVISADVSTTEYGKSADFNHEISDQASLTAPICFKSIRIQSIDDIPTVVHDSFRHFRFNWPQPIHIGIPTDILEESRHVKFPSLPQMTRVIPDANQLKKASELIRFAKAPIMILGGGSHNARHLLPKLAGLINAPVLTTMNGKDSFPNDHELYIPAGVTFDAALQALNDSDLIIAVGTQFGRSDFATISATDALPRFARLEAPLIRIDITPSQLKVNMPATVELLSDSRLAVEALLADLVDVDKLSYENRADEIRTATYAEAKLTGEKYRPWLKQLRDNISDYGVIAIDSTLVAYLGFPFIDIPATGSWLYPSAFGTLGYALPAAIGAKIADPLRPAIAIIGDGGFLFTCTELITAVENNVCLPVVVWNDHGFGTIRQGMQNRGVSPIGVDFSIPSLEHLAKGLGCRYVNPKTPSELGTFIGDSLQHLVPTIIEVIE
jgi:thiamine pyrophosphate-dependent acetolactate synthase large subunit-like protein